MENMPSPDKNYPFDDIKIKTPKALQGGTYCANLLLNDTPLLIQTPKCKTKNGVHKTKNQIYCDLVLTQDHTEFIDWFDNLQSKVRELILQNSSNWFHESPTLDEIEYNWNDSIRTRREYYLLRSFVHKTKGVNKVALQIFDTDENQLNMEDVDNEKNVVCILEIIGLKFSSNSFHLEIGLRQLMVINEKPIFDKCLIKLNSNKKNGEKLESNEKKLVLENNEKEVIEPEKIEDNEDKEDEPVLTETEVNEAVLENLVDNEEVVSTEEVLEKPKEVEKAEEVSQIEENEKVLEKEVQQPIQEIVKEEVAKSLEKNNDLEEIELDISEEEPMKLKNPQEVYLDIYKQAREKAKKAKNEAIKAYLEAKRIKELYMLDIVDSSSSDEESEEEEELFSEN